MTRKPAWVLGVAVLAASIMGCAEDPIGEGDENVEDPDYLARRRGCERGEFALLLAGLPARAEYPDTVCVTGVLPGPAWAHLRPLEGHSTSAALRQTRRHGEERIVHVAPPSVERLIVPSWRAT